MKNIINVKKYACYFNQILTYLNLQNFIKTIQLKISPELRNKYLSKKISSLYNIWTYTKKMNITS